VNLDLVPAKPIRYKVLELPASITEPRTKISICHYDILKLEKNFDLE